MPFLDPVVVGSVRATDLTDQTKAPLRELLSQLVPARRLPGVKKGLAVDVHALLQGGLANPCARELNEPDSIIGKTYGPTAQRVLAQRAQTSVNLAFRIAQLGLWQEALSDA